MIKNVDLMEFKKNLKLACTVKNTVVLRACHFAPYGHWQAFISTTRNWQHTGIHAVSAMGNMLIPGEKSSLFQHRRSPLQQKVSCRKNACMLPSLDSSQNWRKVLGAVAALFLPVPGSSGVAKVAMFSLDQGDPIWRPHREQWQLNSSWSWKELGFWEMLSVCFPDWHDCSLGRHVDNFPGLGKPKQGSIQAFVPTGEIFVEIRKMFLQGSACFLQEKLHKYLYIPSC